MILKAVIFDMDGVLMDTIEYHYRSWKRVCEEYEISFNREDNEKLRGLTRRKSLETLLKGRQISKVQKQEILDRKNKYFLELIKKSGPTELSPGVIELLQELRAAQIRIGVASSSRNVRDILDRLGIDGFFDEIGDGFLVRESRPAPDVYLYTARALKVLPYECIAVEDGEAGIQAASSAGMCVIGLGHPQRVRLANTVLIDLSGVHVKDLREAYTRWIDLKHRDGFEHGLFTSPHEVEPVRQLEDVSK